MRGKSNELVDSVLFGFLAMVLRFVFFPKVLTIELANPYRSKETI